MKRCGLIIAGPASGVGKTTVALGLMAALSRRGLAVQPFKCGPDFIDAGLHQVACGRRSRNLDLWMLPPAANLALFERHAGGCDLAVVEGMMGLFDGAGPGAEASTAGLAKLLGLPVVLVVDGSRMAGSVAALAHGFASFDPAVRVAGVIFNQLGGEGHYRLLRASLEDAGGVAALGYLPADPELHIPERHLGLRTAAEGALRPDAVDRLVAQVEEGVNLGRVLEIAADADDGAPAPQRPADPAVPPAAARPRIAVARDEAFCFYYEDNLDALRDAGAELAFFSPLRDAALPACTRAVYLGGGYPELYARQLENNQSMRAAVRAAAAAGVPIYAECGGLMYLGRELRTPEGGFAMADVLPVATALSEGLVGFGYREVRLLEDGILGPAGTVARGHSFHYSRIEEAPAELAAAYGTQREAREGFRLGSVQASYIHLHFGSNPVLAANLVGAARGA